MKRKFTLLIAALALLTMIVQPGRAWGQSESTSSLIFTEKCNGSGTADDGAVWTVTSDAAESNFDNTKGIHYGTGSAQVKYITLTTSDISGTITNIVVNASVASGVSAVLNVTVGGDDFGTQGQSTSTTPTDYTFTGSASGEIVVTHTKSAKAAKALYLKSIIVTYTTGGGSTTYTVTYNANGATSGNVPTDSNEYSSGEAATVLDNTGNLAKTGNTWSGWTRTIGDEPKTYAAGDTLIIKANTTLLAKWTANTHNVTIPATDTYGSYEMDQTNPVAYGTEVTLTYTPASGYSGHTATWSVNGTPLAGNKFTMPDEDVIVTVSVAPYEQPTTVYIDMNYQWLGSTNGGNLSPEQLPVIKTDDNVTTTITDGTSTRPRGDTDYIRIYKGSTLTFDAPDGYSITQIVFTTGGNNTWNAPSVSSGTLSDKTWTGNAESVTFDLSGSCFISMATIDLGQSSLPTPTVTIDATGITNTNVFTGTEAGSLSASVTYEETPVEGATVTWSGNNDNVATINETTGAVTLVAAGSVTFTATFAGNASYNGASKNYEMTVTNFDPDGPGTQNNPYTVAQAIANTPSSGNVYIHGIVSSFYNTSIVGDGTNYRYYISDDGTTATQLLVYKGKGLNNETFDDINDLLVGDEVVIYGSLITYQNAPEVASGNYLYSWNRPTHDVETPTFSPVAGTYAEAQSVAMSCTTEGAAIHYTTDGSEPDGNSDVYETPIQVSTTTTFKAKAIKGSDASTVATANYYICSQDDPYTVTEALAFADYQYPANGIYVHGIVSTAPTQAPTSSGQLTYYISADGTTTDQLQVYKGKGLNDAAFTAQDDIQVGDIVTILGNVKIYNEQTEFDQGNYLVEFERPEPATITLSSYDIDAPAEETIEVLTLTYTNIENFDINNLSADYCNSDGSEIEGDKPDFVAFDFSEDEGYKLTCTISENEGNARTAYFKVIYESGENNYVYSDVVTVTQAASVTPVPSITLSSYAINAPAEEAIRVLTLTYTNIENFDINNLSADYCNSDGTDIEGDKPDFVAFDFSEDEGYKLTCTISENEGDARTAYFKVIYEIEENNKVYSDVVTVTQEAAPTPSSPYIRIDDLSSLTDGSKVIIAARYDEEHTTGYYAMPGQTSGKPAGVAFTSETSSAGEILPASITDSEDTYYWTVNVTDDGYTFTNANNQMIGWTSSTNFATGGNNTEWNIEFGTSDASAMVANYEAFTITNHNSSGRGFALNSSHNFGPYATSNYNSSDYNFFLDFFVQGATPVPSIAISPATINEVPCYGGGGLLEVTYTNMGDNPNPSVIECDSEGNATDYDWLTAELVNGNANINGTIAANESTTDRTAYLKVCGTDANSETVCSNIVSITQLGYPTITTAELPFTFDGNNEAIEATDGIVQAGLGSSYGDSPKLKFKETGSFVILHFDETPGILTYDIQGDEFNGTFKVQASADNVTYTDLKVYTSSNLTSTKLNESFDDLASTVRYIKWVYTEATSGKVRLGNIGLTDHNPAIIPATYAINVDAGEHTDELAVTYQWVEEDMAEVVICDAEGNETTYDWFTAEVNTTDYNVTYIIGANATTSERKAYFKIYSIDENADDVYSDIVTVTQEGMAVDYATLPFEYEGGVLSDFSALNGTSYSLDKTDSYAGDHAPYRIKFTKTGDYLQVKTDSQPGIVTIGVKMIGGANTSYIYVQGSTNGETFDDGEALEISGAQNDILTLTSTRTFEENVRYVRLSFDKGSNVGVGPITIAKAQPSIALNSSVTAPCTETNGTLTVTYTDINTELVPSIYWYESDGTTQTDAPTWMDADVNTSTFNVDYLIEENEGAERKAYFKVYGIDNKGNDVYSNLVTVTQSEAQDLYTVTLAAKAYNQGTMVEIPFTGSITVSATSVAEGSEVTIIVDCAGDDGTHYRLESFSVVDADDNTYPLTFEKDGDVTTIHFEMPAVNVTVPMGIYKFFNVTAHFNGESVSQEAISTTDFHMTAPTGFALAGWVWDETDYTEAGEHEFLTFSADDQEVWAVFQRRVGGTKNRFAKITSTDELADGYYLIVCESENVAFNGGLETLDVATNKIDVEIEDDAIITTTENIAACFAIYLNASNYYSIVSYSNSKYIGRAANSNGLDTSDEDLNNEISFDADGNADIAGTGGPTLRYNKSVDQKRFRYYKSGQQPIQLYKYVPGTGGTTELCTRVFVGTNNMATLSLSAPAVVTNNALLNVTGAWTNTYANYLIIDEGGQLKTSSAVNATVRREIHKAPTWNSTESSNDGWYTISSPINGNLAATDVTGLLTTGDGNDFDLYKYDEVNSYWRTYKEAGTQNAFNIEPGTGYLYASQAGTMIEFAGEINKGDVDCALTAGGAAPLTGFNLIGNPYSHNIYKGHAIPNDILASGYYILSKNGGWITKTDDDVIAPSQGILVKATTAGDITMTSTMEGPSAKSYHDNIKFMVSNNQYEDIAYAWFDKGVGLNKIGHRNSNIPMIYIPQDGTNYAIATMDDDTKAFNLNFKAMTTGQYTLSFDAKGNYSYLHVIDRLTGEDIDMLFEGEYNFIGSPRDNEARFIVKLDYSANIDELEVSDSFAYQSGDVIIVNGEGTLQVYDVMGRFVRSININGSESINASEFSTGVYVFRMVGNDVKAQKVVIR